MEIQSISNFQVQGNPQRLDKVVNQAYIDAIKKHIEFLEEKIF